MTVLSLDTHLLAGDSVNPDISDLSSQHKHYPTSNGYFSLGIHPWFIAQQDIEQAFKLIVQHAHNPNMLAIGECGLDKCIALAQDRQIETFLRQIELAKTLNKPLIIHCVRAFNELIQLKKACKADQAWIVHGFNGKADLAYQLLRQGFHLSLGKVLLNPASNASRVLPQIPLERVFLETDAAADISINEIYLAAATILNLDITILRQQIHSNFSNVFLND